LPLLELVEGFLPAGFDIKKAKAGTFPSCWTPRREKAAGGAKKAQDPLAIKSAVLEDVDAEQGTVTQVCGITGDVKDESLRGEIEKEQAKLQQAVEAAGKSRKLDRRRTARTTRKATTSP
jgi:hypothetical protein